MTALKRLLIGVIGMVFGLALLAPTYAGAEAANPPTEALTASDAAFAFRDAAQPMQVAVLSPTEMKETQGGDWWYTLALINYLQRQNALINPILAALLASGATIRPTSPYVPPITNNICYNYYRFTGSLLTNCFVR